MHHVRSDRPATAISCVPGAPQLSALRRQCRKGIPCRGMDVLSSTVWGCFGTVSSQLKLWIPELVAEEVRRPRPWYSWSASAGTSMPNAAGTAYRVLPSCDRSNWMGGPSILSNSSRRGVILSCIWCGRAAVAALMAMMPAVNTH